MNEIQAKYALGAIIATLKELAPEVYHQHAQAQLKHFRLVEQNGDWRKRIEELADQLQTERLKL